MKLENRKRYNQLADQLNNVENALRSVEPLLVKYTKDSPPWGNACEENALYAFNLSKYGDGSGFDICLDGCCVGIGILHHTRKLLKAKEAEILAEIETL
jgi:hypothetical protein